MPGLVSGSAYGYPGRQGTTTLTSVSSGSTRSKRRNESGQPCSSTTVGASAPATWWIDAQPGVAGAVCTQG